MFFFIVFWASLSKRGAIVRSACRKAAGPQKYLRADISAVAYVVSLLRLQHEELSVLNLGCTAHLGTSLTSFDRTSK